jgi:pSer/pThr/pTyr-binding forkhead associated (FHA) protein
MSQSLTLRGIAGIYKGSVFPSPQGKLVIGRDARLANIVYPPNTPGVSSVHCEVKYENGMFVLIDKNSSNGTFLADGTRLTPNQPYPIARKNGFYLASRENMFEIE